MSGIDALHRLALHRLAALVDAGDLSRIRAGDPAVEWLFSAYGVGGDEREVTEAALAGSR